VTTELLHLEDPYLRAFRAEVVAADGARCAVALSATAFFPGGGGQEPDAGTLLLAGGPVAVTGLAWQDGLLWHVLAPGSPLPRPGERVAGELDWDRRHALMRVHTALHLVNGIAWSDHGARVTGARVAAGHGRVDLELAAISQELGREIERRVAEQVAADLAVRAVLVPRAQAVADPALARSAAKGLPPVDPVRVIEIEGVDRQACSGTHVASTGEIGPVVVTGTESKGRTMKRVRIALA
jgi:misacylated tRNA(Ala) deacylase